MGAFERNKKIHVQPGPRLFLWRWKSALLKILVFLASGMGIFVLHPARSGVHWTALDQGLKLVPKNTVEFGRLHWFGGGQCQPAHGTTLSYIGSSTKTLVKFFRRDSPPEGAKPDSTEARLVWGGVEHGFGCGLLSCRHWAQQASPPLLCRGRKPEKHTILGIWGGFHGNQIRLFLCRRWGLAGGPSSRPSLELSGNVLISGTAPLQGLPGPQNHLRGGVGGSIFDGRVVGLGRI